MLSFTCFEIISPTAVADNEDIDSSALALAIFQNLRGCEGKLIVIKVKSLICHTGLPAYSDTAYSDSLLTVTVFGSKFGPHLLKIAG